MTMANKKLSYGEIPPDTGRTDQDIRMLKLLARLINEGDIEYRQEFLDVCGMSKQNFVKVIQCKHSFTVAMIAAVCKHYGVSCDWILLGRPPIYRVNKIINKVRLKVLF